MKKIFEIVTRDASSRARAGVIHTAHGPVETPVFMPVGTQGAIKALLWEDMEKLGVQIVLGNTYHLYLRPGLDVIEKAGGLHGFCGWKNAILTDSGGYQVFSLEQLRKITEEGVEFRSHIDGSAHFFTPENVIETQRKLGSDIVMCFDECPPYPSEEAQARRAVEITTRWAKRCKASRLNDGQLLYGITQGSIYPNLRLESAQQLIDMDFHGYAIGGLAVGEPQPMMHETIERSTEILPENKPRYLMGVGTPEDLWRAVELGIDQFDCVLPTRNGRNGQLFTSEGKINIRNAPYRFDFSPPDPACDCELCARYSRAYLHHLFRAGELGALRLASLHNVAFLIKLLRQIRQSIIDGNFQQHKQRFLSKYLALEERIS